MDPGHQLPGREGLGHVVVGPELEPEDAVDLVVPGTEDEHRDTDRSAAALAGTLATSWVFGAQSAADVEPVELPGQTDVDDDQLRALSVDHGQAGLAVVELEHPEPVPPEVHGHEVRDVMVVLDHYHCVLCAHHVLQTATGTPWSPVMVREV